jgi:hypothetical protein
MCHCDLGFSDAGTYRATVSARDGTHTDTESFAITVSDVDQSPSLASIPGVA